MKFNWGHGIAIFMIAFIIAILSAVYYITSQTVELVEEDYYQKEVTYQQVIDAKVNSKHLADSISLIVESEYIIVKFAPSLSAISKNGIIHFYRPNNAKLDKEYQISEYVKDYEFKLKRDDIPSGKYGCSINWSSNGKSYIWEKDINI